MKRQLNVRISSTTALRLDALIPRHGTQTEVVTLAIDRMYEHEQLGQGRYIQDTISVPGRVCPECGEDLKATLGAIQATGLSVEFFCGGRDCKWNPIKLIPWSDVLPRETSEPDWDADWEPTAVTQFCDCGETWTGDNNSNCPNCGEPA